jgi:hypothetical protein
MNAPSRRRRQEALGARLYNPRLEAKEMSGLHRTVTPLTPLAKYDAARRARQSSDDD